MTEDERYNMAQHPDSALKVINKLTKQLQSADITIGVECRTRDEYARQRDEALKLNKHYEWQSDRDLERMNTLVSRMERAEKSWVAAKKETAQWKEACARLENLRDCGSAMSHHPLGPGWTPQGAGRG